MSALQRKISKANRLPGRSKPSKSTNSNWQKVVFIDEEERPCVDLIVDGVKRQFSVQDLVCLVYHGPRPEKHVSYVIDTSKPCTPDNVGWISEDAAFPDRRDGSTTKEIKRQLIRSKLSVKWNEVFSLTEDGALYLDGEYDGHWKPYFIADFLSQRYHGPWPAQDSYAFIIDLSKPIWATNVAWMTQNPDYRRVSG
jgi:hypothetical protein